MMGEGEKKGDEERYEERRGGDNMSRGGKAERRGIRSRESETIA